MFLNINTCKISNILLFVTDKYQEADKAHKTKTVCSINMLQNNRYFEERPKTSQNFLYNDKELGEITYHALKFFFFRFLRNIYVTKKWFITNINHTLSLLKEINEIKYS